ncbi:MAG: hypothetical protein J6N46_05750, partial [Bacteroidales bacterium]|nr:hypothetical protein [Bacteroidales bacterium]
MKVTAHNLVKAISCLSQNREYNYVNNKTPGRIRIIEVNEPDGPIVIRRWNPNKGESFRTAKNETISSEMLWRLANALS